jgi:acyl carrier protein
VSALRRLLREALPEYMVPAAFVVLDALPLTPNGKVDREALPAPEGERQVEAAYVAPRSELEAQIAQIWREVLGLEQVGIDDNFFDLGGNSLLLIRVHGELHELLRRELPITDLFRFPTIRALAAYCGETSSHPPLTYRDAHDRAQRQRAAMNRQRKITRAQEAP